jgi:ribosomal protein S12 methylthiotransferase
MFKGLRGNKVHFTSLGCPRNLVDTEVMLGIMLQAGFEVTDQTNKADYLVVNTCGFLESARQESLDTIQALLAEKKKSAKVVVTGCMVRNHKDIITENIPQVNYLLGSGDVHNILELINQDEEKELISTQKSYLQAGEVPRTLSTPKHYAYLKIAEGCRKACAFCIIPKIKGALKSKTQEQIIAEFKALLAQGVQEIILIAQDLGDFGKDRKEINGLESLLKELTKINGKFWIRLLYLYPDEITDELIAVIKSDSRICAYLDMPIQHINNEMLKAMKRKTSKEDIISTVQKLRKEIPGIIIRTSLMVGFPGETEEQFDELKAFIKQYPLDNIGIFKYSNEEGSSAYNLEGQIEEAVKDSRFKELMSVQEKIVKKRSKAWIGKQIEVMLEGYHPETDLLMTGRFYGQCPEIDGMVILNDHQNAKAFGKLHKVEITDVAGYDLIGSVIGPVESPKPARPLKLAKN